MILVLTPHNVHTKSIRRSCVESTSSNVCGETCAHYVSPVQRRIEKPQRRVPRARESTSNRDQQFNWKQKYTARESSSKWENQLQVEQKKDCRGSRFSIMSRVTELLILSHEDPFKPISDVVVNFRMEQLGFGYSSKVYLVDVTGWGRVAEKFISATWLERAQHWTQVRTEVEILKANSSRFCISLLGESVSNAGVSLIFPYYRNGTLLDMLKTHHKEFSERDRRFIATQIFIGIAHIHDRGCIHRDIKPDNCVIDDFGNIRIIDFGLATKNFGLNFGELQAQCGTLHYMAPEVKAGHGCQPASDWWSFGVLIYEMYTGESFMTEEALARETITSGWINQRLSSNTTLSESAHGLLHALFKTDPKNRPTAEQIALSAFLNELTTPRLIANPRYTSPLLRFCSN